MEERGKVIRIDEDTVEVAIDPSDACANCPACHYCRPSGTKRVITAVNPGDISVGDEVFVTMIRRHSLIAIFAFFGLPVMLSLIGLLIGQHYSETGSLIIGSGGFLLGLIIAKIINDILGSKRGFYPRIDKISEK